MRSNALLVVALLAACERPDVLIVCHNSNCAEPQDPANDDTVEALYRSLALGFLDGTELDLVVDGDRCWFAHDARSAASSIEIVEAAAIVGDYLRDAHEGGRFIVELELKQTLEIETSVACALAANELLRDAAATRGIVLDVNFTSYVPAMLRAVDMRRPADTDLARTRLVLGIGIPQPLLDDNRPLAQLGGMAIDIAEIHPGWITDTALRVLRSADVEIGAWFLDMNRETLDGLARLRPTYVLTGQARAFKLWLDG